MSPDATLRRPPVFGPEAWSEVACKAWCHWDLWFCVVAVLDHGGDLGAVEDVLVVALGDRLGGRDTAEAKLSHLEDLRRRLAEAGIGARDLAGSEVGADKVLVAKARRKVADRGLEGRAMTPAMVDTPRARLTRRSRTGRWGAFPVDPARSYVSFRRNVEVKDHISKSRSFAVTARLEERLDRLDAACTGVDQRLGENDGVTATRSPWSHRSQSLIDACGSPWTSAPAPVRTRSRSDPPAALRPR